jgi:hypothetical protein
MAIRLFLTFDQGRIGETTSQSTKPTSWQVAGYAIRPYEK